MWITVAKFILRFRLVLLLLILLITAFMGYHAGGIRLTYSFPKILPATHPQFLQYNEFKATFGEDGNVMVIGLQTDRMFEQDVFNDWYALGNEVEAMEGIEGVLSIPHSFKVQKNKEEKKFDIVPLVAGKVTDKTIMDSLKTAFYEMPFYKGLIYNPETKASLMAIQFEQKLLDSKQRIDFVNRIIQKAEVFSDKHHINLHYSGLPYIRSFQVTKISEELITFLVLASLLIGLVLFILFRSLPTVIFPLIVVMISVIWAVGSLALFEYEVSVLTGLIPTLIVVIGIPNCVYFLNKYHEEFRKHGSRLRALTSMIVRIGHVTFFANLTTAIGFGVFALMDSQLLREFGIVAGLNIAGTYLISLIVIPIIFSYLPNPKSTQTKHLDSKFLNRLLEKLVDWTAKYKGFIQLGTLGLLVVCVIGLLQLKSEGYLFDDVSHEAKEYKDLKFFERNFKGVMPFDVVIDTRKKGGVTKLSFMKKLDKVHKIFEKDSLFSRPISLIDGIKFANQAYYNGKEKYYDLPSNLESSFIFKYLANSGESDNNVLKTLTDSLQQKARISVNMADVGSKKFPEVIKELKPKIEAVLDTSRYGITYTGTSLIALEGYNYLVNGLIYSVLLAFLLIALIIAYLFRSIKMLLIALLPNLIPLLVTASLMGYFNIALKPSTVLIFSVAFGISVDFTIHFLAKYRMELLSHNQTVEQAVKHSIQETGYSMVYTALILFCGFIIFSWSEFTGTYFLGVLTSITLVVALIANLVLLPSVILSVHQWLEKK